MAVTYKLGAGWEAVETALHDWLKEQAAVPVVRWQYPEAPMPGTETGVPQDFGLLAIPGFYPRGLTPDVQLRQDTTRPPDEDLERIQRRPGVLVVAVDVITRYADGPDSAFPRLLKAAAALDSPTVFRPFRRAGLGLQAKGDVRTLSGLVGIAKQGRAALELRFNVGEVTREWAGAAASLRTTRTT